MSRLITLCISLVLALVSTAQESWVVTRSAVLHSSYSSSSPTVANLAVGTQLEILSPQMRNNYYRVRATATGATGWVYKTRIAPAGADLDSVSVRVIDVDNGLCAIIRLPGNKYVIYDAGGLNSSDGSATWEQMKAFLPEHSTVEFMVLSHMDGDHIVAASQAIRGYNIKQVLWGGYDRKIEGSSATETKAFQRLKAALEERHDITESINLHEHDSMIVPGNDVAISGVHFKFLCGFGEPPAAWRLSDAAEKLNGVSIVMKMEYAGNSVLFTGDALGRRKDDPEDKCIATEAFLVDNAGDELKSNVMFSPHHGAENGSSRPFMDKVNPEYIIIPAGHVATFLHPRKTTCERYLDYVAADRIFRTDRGDDQGVKEWDYLRIPGCNDRAGDDDIQVDMRSDKHLHVYYLDTRNVCTTGH